MAGEDGVRPVGVVALEADGDDLTFVDYTCRLLSLERVEADEPDDDLDDLFTVTFAVDGPDANAQVEIMVSDCEDDAHVVGVALDTLHRAMKAWGRVTENRRIAARDVDELKGDRPPAAPSTGATGRFTIAAATPDDGERDGRR